jgi:ATP phosphoribosyltransferase
MLLNGKLKIAVQKSGRLFEESITILKSIGLDFNEKSNKLFALVKNYPIEIIFLRDDDIPEYVQDGICQLGMVGYNEILEKKVDIDLLIPLNFGQCKLSIAKPIGSEINSIEDLEGKRIASSYPVVLKDYLAKKGIKCKIIEISGSVEICPSLDVADAIADLVSTGSTLKANQLEILTDIVESEAYLIKSKVDISPELVELIEKLSSRISAYLNAKASKYLMLNCKRSHLNAIISNTPSLETPTILSLSDPNYVSVHSVIPNNNIWNLVENLKDLGASGILITKIENLMP